MTTERIECAAFLEKVMTAEEAVTFISDGDCVALGGFGPPGTPKATPRAIGRLAAEQHAKGGTFSVSLLGGASSSPDADGSLARAEAVNFRIPYMADPDLRAQINAGLVPYVDFHLSKLAPWARAGFFGKVDVAIIEAARIRRDGGIVPTCAIGTAKTWLQMAGKVIIEVNTWHSHDIEGLHDVWMGDLHGPEAPGLDLAWAGQRIGEPVLRVDPGKVVAVVRTDEPDMNVSFRVNREATTIAGHIIDFLKNEVARGRLPSQLPPLQSCVGNVANAVMLGLIDAPFDNLTGYTEIIQDGMFEMLKAGKMRAASAAALYLSKDQAVIANNEMVRWRDKIIIRQQEVSNNPAIVRKLSCLTFNSAIEADIYGNINSSRMMGSNVHNGIGGSGDFARGALISFFMTPSTAKGGAISSIVPMVAHVDHIDQDVQVFVTEQGLADLRGLSARQRAQVIIENCAHPSYRPMLKDYFARAQAALYGGGDTPVLLNEALSWHQRYLEHGTMAL
ncbi:acetyl-CoA hydrolase/transferase C-terminal domain-containing protein [Sphingobium sp. YR768]|uniref:acetyl-CoA hydrolase/transferase C-terminal domain-containing protein n=1 Tax=Sphingobium sp. YR768 TaxID=1884365 RepID=UPI0008D83EA4|nr:acetyl-CoA hydrolase/transferase C-terminal domain-containing protein [Sphingobium sp. YR768]SES22126.1 succinyl-CoA:acetate CoA-transferase [Sphingobium sp. YR768]